jgi:mannose-6-phosphate isomerase
MHPVHLGTNQPADRFYAGGARIAEFRGLPALPVDPAPHVPEDWVASTTTVFGTPDVGLTTLPDGRTLKEAIEDAPAAWLGAEHLSRHGTDVILVKLLDAGERLPVHLHPDRRFSREHLGLSHGKTEAWIALRDAEAHIAFSRDVAADELRGWVERQDVDAILSAMHRVPVRAGDAIFLPAGLPHAIGAGNFVIELQEPTDLSILLEWRGYPIDGRADGHLGLGFDVALAAVDRRGRSREDVLALISAPTSVDELFPDAGEFFRASRLTGGAGWAAGFAVVVVVAGAGTLSTADGPTPLVAGDTVVVPFAAGACVLEGDVEAILCRPPA